MRHVSGLAGLNTILCQWHQLWRKTSRATRRLVEPLEKQIHICGIAIQISAQKS
jgi:hypothetical protein